MLFDNIDFHNVSEMKKTDNGYSLLRLPSEIMSHMDFYGSERERSYMFSSGIELRFEMLDDKVTLILQADKLEEAATAYIYYGDFQGTWRYSSKVINEDATEIDIEKPENLEDLRKLSEQCGAGFDPAVVRVVLPYVRCKYVGIKGNVIPPLSEHLPKKTYLAYGSSITHGSLALAGPYTYPFRIAQKFKCDYLNFGFAGACHLEEHLARYIVSKKDWDFASLEMGINMVDCFSPEEFEERVKIFTDIIAADGRTVFCTSIFRHNYADQETSIRFREIIRKHTSDKLIFTDGLELLENPMFISADGVHPSLEGMEQIVDRWYQIMESTELSCLPVR